VTEPSPSVVAAVESFCDRHQARPADVHPTGLRAFVDDATTDEIAAALDELAARSNGSLD
jgi:hypothetical protein